MFQVQIILHALSNSRTSCEMNSSNIFISVVKRMIFCRLLCVVAGGVSYSSIGLSSFFFYFSDFF